MIHQLGSLGEREADSSERKGSLIRLFKGKGSAANHGGRGPGRASEPAANLWTKKEAGKSSAAEEKKRKNPDLLRGRWTSRHRSRKGGKKKLPSSSPKRRPNTASEEKTEEKKKTSSARKRCWPLPEKSLRLRTPEKKVLCGQAWGYLLEKQPRKIRRQGGGKKKKAADYLKRGGEQHARHQKNTLDALGGGQVRNRWVKS